MTDAAVVPFEQRVARVARNTRPGIESVRYKPPLVDAGFTAAAARLDPNQPDEIKRLLARREPWQAQCWQVYDDTAEVGRSADFMADAMYRVRWFPGVKPDPDTPPLPLDATDENDRPLVDPRTQEAVNDAFRRLGGGSAQSISGLFSDAALQLFVPGEGYLVGYTSEDEVNDDGLLIEPGDEVWRVVSSDQIHVDDRGRVSLRTVPQATMGGSAMGVLSFAPTMGGGPDHLIRLPEDAFVMRFWSPHPRFYEASRSPVRRVLLECEELKIKLLEIRSHSLQRLHSGILVIPKSMSGGAINEVTGLPVPSPLAEQIIRHTTAPINDPGSAAAVAPYLLEADQREGQKVEWLTHPGKLEDNGERAELSRRIVMGLPVPEENILGLGDTSTYANARVVTEQTVIMYIDPFAALLADSFSYGYLHRELRARGIEDVRRFAIGADSTPLVSRPNEEQSVTEAYDRIEITGDYYRDKLGIPPEAEPDEVEVAARLERIRIERGAAPLPDTDDAGESNDPNAGDPTASEAQAEGMAAAAKVTDAAVDRAARKLARVESDLRSKVHAYLAALMERALEKAGAKARTKARNQEAVTAAIGTVPNGRVCAQLGPSMVAALSLDEDELLAEVLAGGREQVLAWMASAQGEVLRTAARFGDLDDEDLERLEARQAEDRDAGWLLMLAALTVVTRARLFDPDPTAPEVGEFDGSPLPFAPIAAGLARAGGASGEVLTVPFHGQRLPAAVAGPDGTPVIGGATLGETGQEILSAANFAMVGWTWETGTPDRPFEPHQNLDGLEFTSWFDDRLANPGDWPPHPFFYAGDHVGCLCQTVPSFEEAER